MKLKNDDNYFFDSSFSILNNTDTNSSSNTRSLSDAGEDDFGISSSVNADINKKQTDNESDKLTLEVIEKAAKQMRENIDIKKIYDIISKGV